MYINHNHHQPAGPGLIGSRIPQGLALQAFLTLIYLITSSLRTRHCESPARRCYASSVAGGRTRAVAISYSNVWRGLLRRFAPRNDEGDGLPRPFGLAMTIILFLFAFLFPSLSFADDLKSPTFEIQMSTINITGGRKSNESGTINLTDTVGQTFQGQFNSAGYVILAGFQYINTLIPFSFKISNLDINFGSLVPGVPSTLTNTLTVTTGSAFGFTVKAIEDHPLRRSDGTTTIADTACNLATPCIPTDANIWDNNGRYGFGYRMSGNDVDTADFVDDTYFRPFPIENIDPPAIVMSKGGIATSSAATVTYKVNISGVQAAGTYQNSIQYIAIPSF